MPVKGTTLALKTMVGGSPPVSRSTRGLLELNGQFLRFRETVKLIRMGETHQLKPVVFVEIMLRHMEHVVFVVEKIPGSRSQPQERYKCNGLLKICRIPNGSRQQKCCRSPSGGRYWASGS